MRRTEKATVANRMLSMKEAMNYLRLSRNTTRAFCVKANAIVRFGGRVLIDKFALDKAIDELKEENNKEA